ncbi:cyclin-like protein [Kickxella alabastrina]|uniref:cyclin-like protein n=1 Tax=Kickxella alabastrina TaxID=61397 RepID=UPI00221F5ABB|nr:cyclin-like protein [Kickxella alabastrina]KAI7824944.1 cyclin-like protein [Kickxella alabastrina]
MNTMQSTSSNHRHSFMSRSHIVTLLNGTVHDDDEESPNFQNQLLLLPSTERHEISDHPAMASASKCCVFIKELARTLCFPARTISTAQLLVHRTYINRPNYSANTADLATACLFVAAKMEETIKRLRDILAHSYVISSSSVVDPQSVPVSVTDKMRPTVLAAEQFVLEAIGFDFRTAHPHLMYVKLAKMANVPISTVAAGWSILADAYFTTLPVQYPSVLIAAGALCLAWNLDCTSPQDTSRFVRTSLGIHGLPTEASKSHSGGRRGSNTNNRQISGRQESTPANLLFPAQSRERPQSISMYEEWWAKFGVATSDMQSFVRQMADFYLLFFNGNAASAGYLERHRNGIPSSDMSRRIGQWRLWLENASITPVSPKRS